MAPGQKVLVVEDNPINMELAATLLESAGYRVLRAQDAEEGIVLAGSVCPSIILMDVGLPGMDGLKATAVLKQNPKTNRIPIVALTAHAMKGDRERALEAGCDGYIEKPIDTRRFPQMVAGFLRSNRDPRP